MRPLILMLIVSFVLAACGHPAPAPAPVVPITVPSSTTSAPVESVSLTLLPSVTASPVIPHVDVFLAEQAFFEKLAKARGYHGVYVRELGSPDTATFNPDVQFHGASTIKIAVAVVTLKVSEDLGWDIYSFIPPGQSKTVADLIKWMIVDHSEYASNFLIHYINSLGFHFDDELIKLGLPGFNVGQRLATPHGLGLLLERLDSDSLGLLKNQFLVDLLATYSITDTETFPWAVNHSLPGNYVNMVGALYRVDQTIPSYGNIKYVADDCGVWITPEGRTIIVVFLGNYSTEVDFVLNQDVIHEEVAILTEYFSK